MNKLRIWLRNWFGVAEAADLETRLRRIEMRLGLVRSDFPWVKDLAERMHNEIKTSRSEGRKADLRKLAPPPWKRPPET